MSDKLRIECGILIKCDKDAVAVVIPRDVHEICSDAFDDCKLLASIESLSPKFTAVGGLLYQSRTKKLITTTAGNVTISAEIKSLDQYALSNCTSVSFESGGHLMSVSRKLIANDEVKNALKNETKKNRAKKTKIEMMELATAQAVLNSLIAASTAEVETKSYKLGQRVAVKCESCGIELCLPNANVFIWKKTLPIFLAKVAAGASFEELFECAKALKMKVADGTNIWKYVVMQDENYIGKYTFYECASLESIVIPEIVTEIGECAFRDCFSLDSIKFTGTKAKWKKVKKGMHWYINTKLSCVYCSDGVILFKPYRINNGVFQEYMSDDTDFVIPKGVTKVGKEAFSYCDDLASVVIPEGVTEIGKDAFSFCSVLKDIQLPDTTLKIDKFAFRSCKLLKSLEIPNGVREIGERAFWWCVSLSHIKIPAGITKIESCTFGCCESLKSVELPESLTKIGDSAFMCCTSLKSISIPNGVKEIGIAAFTRCESFTSISIPAAVTEIGKEAFYECKSLSVFEFRGTKAQWKKVKKGIHWNQKTLLSGVNCSDGFVPFEPYRMNNGVFEEYLSCDADYEIPQGITKVGKYALSKCQTLISVVIPEGVTEIGEGAFLFCKSLKSIIIPDSVTEIGESAFAYCKSLKSIKLPDSLKEIAKAAFGKCVSLKSIKIPNGVTTIGADAFWSCQALKSIIIPDSVTYINQAFNFCSSLKSIQYNGTKAQWGAISKDIEWNKYSGIKVIICLNGEVRL